MNTIAFFLKNYLLRKGKYYYFFFFFWKGNKMKGGDKYALLSAEIDIPPKIPL